MLQLIDTHTHFDVEDFDQDRDILALQAYHAGVSALVLIGFVAERFDQLLACHHHLQQLHWQQQSPQSLLAPGLHPFYIEKHQQSDLLLLENILKQQDCVAIGEIGLDYFSSQHKDDAVKKTQKQYFSEQLALATQYQKPVLLHIRKAHAESIAMLKHHRFPYGGIAHAFSGGIEEARALIKLGFKIGITGQITNPNAKKLHQVVRQIAIDDLVLETDCPDMTPLCCQDRSVQRTRNTPVNLPFVLQGLSEAVAVAPAVLAQQLWKNSLACLALDPSFWGGEGLMNIL